MFCVYDCETTKWSKQNLDIKYKFGVLLFYQGSVKIRESWCFSIEHTVSVLLDMYRFNNNKTFKIFAHNLDYDAKFLYAELLKFFTVEQKGNSKALSITCKILDRFTIRNKKKVPRYKLICEFRNSLALLPYKLVDIGKIVGLHKGGYTDYDAEISQDYIDYCIRDCEVVQKGLQKLVELFSLFGLEGLEIEDLPFTVPALSYKLFFAQNKQYEFKDEKSRKKNRITQISRELEEHFREYYFGGRTEVLISKIIETFFYLDFNSLYPWALTQNLYPIPPYSSYIPKDRITPENLPKSVFALECWVDESKKTYPLLPERINKKNYYRAVKKFFILQREEFIELYNEGCIISVDLCWDCSQWDKPFEYMMKIYDIRKEFKKLKTAERKLEKLCKLPSNSTYGKFAERSKKIILRVYSAIEFYTNNDLFNYVNEATQGNFVENPESGFITAYFTSNLINHSNTNVVFAMRTTALSRLKLYQSKKLSTENGITVNYTDTDSLVVEQTSDLSAISHLLSESELGMLKVEFQGYNFLAVSPKEYIYMEKLETIAEMNIFKVVQKAKGLSGGSLIDYSEKGVSIIRPTKLRECVKRKLPFTSAVEVIKNKTTYMDRCKIDTKNGICTPFKDEILESIIESNKKHIVKKLEEYKAKWGYLIDVWL